MRVEWRIHPDLDLDDILGETYGLPIYQEQIMAILAKVANWSYSEAGLLFDALRKKQTAKMEAGKPGFFEAGKANGHSQEALDALWEALLPWSDYGFNKSHSAGYGLISYWTAYLKANHPAEYMAAVLSSVAEDDRLPDYLAECGRLGLAVLPPDINLSGVGFSPGDGAVHYGIGAIKGVGEAAFGALSKGRPYRSLDDFFRRADPKVLNTGVLGALIRSGTLDSLSPLREELYVARENLATRALAHRAELRAGQRPLYRVAFGVGASGLHDLSTRQQWEQETLSTVLSHGAVTLRAARPVSREELIWLREMFQTHPGKTEVTAQFGVVGVPLGTVDWAAVEANVNLLGAFEC